MGAGLAVCPAGVSQATGTGPSQEPSGTRKVQLQGALAAWLCQHPAHSTALPVLSL